jgi:hypothetical protein
MKDAVWLATTLGHPVEATRWTAMRDEFAADLKASVAATMQRHGMTVLPGCAELGDFDPTSSTVIPTIAEADDLVPSGAEAATWERYWREVEARFTGKSEWDAYTPYEWRNVAAMVRLGWRGRVDTLSSWLMADRRPAGWRQWAEVVPRDTVKARFIGDLPHAWVGSDFIRATLDRLAYADEARQALVLAAGVPASWLVSGKGLSVKELGTPWGKLTYSIRGQTSGLIVELGGGLTVPRGGLVLTLPFTGFAARVNGREVTVEVKRQGGQPVSGELVLRELPAVVEIRWVAIVISMSSGGL